MFLLFFDTLLLKVIEEIEINKIFIIFLSFYGNENSPFHAYSNIFIIIRLIKKEYVLHNESNKVPETYSNFLIFLKKQILKQKHEKPI